MKRLIKILFIATGLTTAFALASCEKDEEALTIRRELTINAAMAAFDALAETRIYNDGDTTYFTSGDSIGIIAIGGDGAIKSDVSNVKATYDGTTWTTAGKIYLYANTTYVAYAPYNPKLDMTQISSADDIAKQYSVGNGGQSTREEYVKADLMVASQGAVSNNSVTFSFRHAFSLIEIVLPRKCYRLVSSGGGIRLPNYYVPAGSLYYLSGINMYSPEPGAYRCIVAPGSKVGITGGYIDANDKVRDFNYYPYSSAITAGHKYTAYVDRTEDESSSSLFTYSQGDLFMKDGTIVKKGTKLTDTQKENCIGVIYYVNNPSTRFGAAEKSALTAMGSTPHGYVLALKEVTLTSGEESINSFAWHSAYHNDIEEIENITTLEEVKSDVNGLNNTECMMRELNEEGYIATALSQFRAENPRPANTTDWFIPSTGQWYDMIDKLGLSMTNGSFGNGVYTDAYTLEFAISSNDTDYVYEKLNNKINPVGSGNYDKFVSATDYWTSNEENASQGRTIQFRTGWKGSGIYHSIIDFGYKSKREKARVRCILAF
jgi:hypothetical protein